MKITTMLLCGAALFATPVLADTAQKPVLAADELAMMAHEHAVNLLEIDLGTFAQRSSPTAGVRDFGKELVTDHKAADQNLLAFAGERGVTIGKDVPASDGEKLEQKDMAASVAKLKTLRGQELDRKFLDMMATGHQRELVRLDTFIGQANDTELKTMLTTLRPVMKKHADAAHALAVADVPRS